MDICLIPIARPRRERGNQPITTRPEAELVLAAACASLPMEHRYGVPILVDLAEVRAVMEYRGALEAAALTRLSRTRWLEVRTPQSRAQARDEHLGIVAAVRDRDADKAPALVVAHCHGTRDRLLSYLAGERRRLRGRGFSIIESSTAPPPLRTG